MDEKWIDDFTNKEKDYNIFYQDNITYINIYIMYVNNNKCLEKVKEKTIYLSTKNILTKEELKEIIMNYKKSENIPYRLISILKHNIDIEPDEIARSLKESYHYNFTSPLKSIDDIVFNKSITTFEDLNSLFFVFYEADKNTDKNTTKRVKLKHNYTHKKKQPIVLLHK
jgi:hypothetical protein